ncbi:hypothetical protein RHSIM_Rhsim01G0104400 [Rhododendron simsii]|uniref:Uncharacterized protein n=1 Tax=Rhododendron simsii TaxID=118357 RepID=A0A834LY40_RHOSS|nr:hypothetical protein RHSIM_Rhsim01G0104400 [Rhododendron simsii]
MPRLQIPDHRRTPMSFEPQSLLSISNAHESHDHHGRHMPMKKNPTKIKNKEYRDTTLNGAMQEGEHKAMQEGISFLQNYYCPRSSKLLVS